MSGSVGLSHAEAAAKNIESALSAGTLQGAVLAQVAQAQATLALVEQQRIANLIAIGNIFEPTEVTDVWDPAPPVLRADIRKGLGL